MRLREGKEEGEEYSSDIARVMTVMKKATSK